VTIERLGAATTKLLTDWLTRLPDTGGKVFVRPVLDLAADRAVDQHDPPAAMREQVVLRDAHCVFPGCGRDSRSCDLDHIVPYIQADDGGPPGQTHPSNLAPLCRHHHRVKTHTGWDYQRLDDGGYDWTAPTGHHYVVTPTSRRPPARTRPAPLLVPPQRRRT
ncbi:MAG: HNH endonuclease signature motif containing protein, partial [Marmoricola sp.]